MNMHTYIYINEYAYIYINEYAYIYIYKWICIHIIIAHNEYNKFLYIYIVCACVCLGFFIWNAYFLKKSNCSSNYYLLWMNVHWLPLKNSTRWVSEGCPQSTEWEVIERGFGGWARTRGRMWMVSPGRVPSSKATFIKEDEDGRTEL